MKRKPLILVMFLLMLYIAPIVFISSYASPTIPAEQNTNKDFVISADWYSSSWNYRKSITLRMDSGIAGTDYQVMINVTYNANMESDFRDIIFVDDDHDTRFDHWLESKIDSTWAVFWVEFQDYMDSNADAYLFAYYGNDETSSLSNGHDTFQEFYDNSSTAGWDTTDITVTTSGDYLRFYNPTAEDTANAQRHDITTSEDFQFMAQYKTVSLGTDDQALVMLTDDSTSHRFSQSMAPYVNIQDEWYYYDGATQAGGAWIEGTEFIFTVQIDEGDSVNGVDIRRYDTSWTLLDSKLSENFALGSPADCDGIYIGDGSGAANIDAYFRWMAFRKCVDVEPEVISWGEEETNLVPEWKLISSGEIIIIIGVYTGGLNALVILLGCIMIPASTLYLVKGGKSEMSTDKLFYGIIGFVLGWAFLLGGVG